MISSEKVNVLMQYVTALGDAAVKLEECYSSKNIEGLEKVKKFILDVQQKTIILLEGE